MWILKEIEKNEKEGMFMDEARVMADQCWDDPRTEYSNYDYELSEVFAGKLSYWMDIAAQNERNTEYYRDLLVQCGNMMGIESYISDDGSLQNDVLCAKIPEMVAKRQIILENINDAMNIYKK